MRAWADDKIKWIEAEAELGSQAMRKCLNRLVKQREIITLSVRSPLRISSFKLETFIWRGKKASLLRAKTK